MKSVIPFWAIFQVVFCSLWLIAAGGNWWVYHVAIHVRIAHHILMTGLLIWWLIRRGLPLHPLTLPGLAMILWLLISAGRAIDQRMAFENAWHWIINILLLFVAIDWARSNKLQTAYSAIFATLAVSTAIMLLQSVLDPAARPGGLFLLTNLGGAMLAAMIVPIYDRLQDYDYVWGRWVTWPVMGLIGFALLMNASRGAWLAVAVSAGVYLWSTGRRWAVAGLVVATLLGVSVMTAGSGRMAGDEVRQHLWESAGAISKAYPLGVGPGLFPQAYREYATMEDDDRLTGAHNLYLNLRAELGIPGLLIGAWMVIMVLRSLLPPVASSYKAAIAALCGIAVHMMFDNFPVTAYAFIVAVLVANLTAHEHGIGFKLPRPHFMRLATATNLGMVSLLVLFAGGLLVWDVGQVYYEQSLRDGSIEAAETALQYDPDNRLYQLHLARLNGDDVQTLIGADVILQQWAMTNYGRMWR